MDLYSLGCVLHELLTGRRPFPGPDTAFMHQHCYGAPTPPREIRPDVPAGLSGLVVRLLAKDPADRPESAATAAAELRQIRQSLGEAAHAARDGRGQDADGAAAQETRTRTITQLKSAPQEAGITHLGSLGIGPHSFIHEAFSSPDGQFLVVVLRRRPDDAGTAVQLWETRA